MGPISGMRSKRAGFEPGTQGHQGPFMKNTVSYIEKCYVGKARGPWCVPGRSLVSLWEHLLARIPLVRSIYSGAKQLAESMFSSSGDSFRKVLPVRFPIYLT